MKSQLPSSPYDIFLETGKVDDYLAYCRCCDASTYYSLAGGMEADYAADHQRIDSQNSKDPGK